MDQDKLVGMLKMIRVGDQETIGWNNAVIFMLRELRGGNTSLQIKMQRYLPIGSNPVDLQIIEEGLKKIGNSKLNAVKFVKDLTGGGLKECKDFVDNIWEDIKPLMDNDPGLPL